MLIGLTGRIASGKGEIADFLKNKKDFVYFTISLAVREEAQKRGIEITRENLQDLGNSVRNKEGAGAWIKRLIEKMDFNKDYIIDGIRNPGEIEELRKLKSFFLISIDSPQKIRYLRVLERDKPSDPKDWEGFLRADERDFGEEDLLGQQVGKCMKLADFHMINDSTLRELKEKFEEIWEKITC